MENNLDISSEKEVIHQTDKPYDIYNNLLQVKDLVCCECEGHIFFGIIEHIYPKRKVHVVFITPWNIVPGIVVRDSDKLIKLSNRIDDELPLPIRGTIAKLGKSYKANLFKNYS